MSERICVICGKPIPSTRHKLTNTCSRECAYKRDLERGRKYKETHKEELAQKAREYQKKYRKNKPPVVLNCKKCGVGFVRKSSRQVYCEKCGCRGTAMLGKNRRFTKLAIANATARAHGLSYGKAVAAGII